MKGRGRLMVESQLAAAGELCPHLLYREEAGEARFATWGVSDGHEALAMFTSAEAAAKYREDLGDSAGWKDFEPPRETLIEILTACRAAGILYAALDPIGGSARTLFDIPRVLSAAQVKT
jgi:hypothetical protein